MIGFYDYAVIAVFVVFMAGIGVYFRNVCKNTSDFLRGGGSMSWYLSGASNFMVTFSAWTFVGCAGKIYKTGTLLIMLFAFNAVAYLLIALFFAHRFRRMRVITPIDAVRRRFGKGSEQVYAWYNTIISFIFGGLGLYTLSIFLAPILGMSVNGSIWVMGLLITFLAVTGGELGGGGFGFCTGADCHVHHDRRGGSGAADAGGGRTERILREDPKLSFQLE